MLAFSSPIDFVDELIYRCWARRNYLPADLREQDWHPLILEEMAIRDEELAEVAIEAETINRSRHSEFVPLVPTLTHIIHPAHLEIREPHFVSMQSGSGGFSLDSIYAGGIYEFQF